MAALGGSITTGGNLATDLATGNMPNFRGAENPAWEIAKYTGGLALDGFGAAGAGSLSNWTFNGGLKNSFGWVQSPYFKPTAGWTTIKNPTTGVLEKISWAAETGVKATRVPLTNFAAQAGKQGINFANDAGKGFKSFDAFKRSYGSAGQNQAWHHIVEQHADNIGQFGAESIHNTNNLIRLPEGAGSIHRKVTGFYNSLMPETGMRVRDYVKTLDYNGQYQFGIETLKKFGWTPK